MARSTRAPRHLSVVPDIAVQDRRRPPRHDRVVYHLRIELDDVDPTIWREFEVPSDLRLDQLHDVVQLVMGWTNSHLHRFVLGSDVYARDGQSFLMDFDIDEGADGVLESEVVVSEVLRDTGDRLLYAYDYGDGWTHTITVLGEREPRADDHVPRCLAGARGCPPEDCGGVGGYQELVEDVAAVQRGEQLDELQAQRVRWLVGDGSVDDATEAFETFDPAAANKGLARRVRVSSLPGKLGELVGRIGGAVNAPTLADALDRIPNEAPSDVDVDLARAMVEPFAWMIRRAGDDGLALTSAGYLKPADVSALAEVLDLSREWIGKLNREDMTPPITDFREAMRLLGLVRKNRGRLVVTAAARSLADDPVGLWWHIAGRLPLGRDAEADAGMAVLLLTAADIATSPTDPESRWLRPAPGPGSELMSFLGWRRSDGDWLTEDDVLAISGPTHVVLLRAGALENDGWGSSSGATPGGVRLARAAILSS